MYTTTKNSFDYHENMAKAKVMDYHPYHHLKISVEKVAKNSIPYFPSQNSQFSSE